METYTHRMFPPLSTAAEAVSRSSPASGTSRCPQERNPLGPAQQAGSTRVDLVCVVPADRRGAHGITRLPVRPGPPESSEPALGHGQHKPRVARAAVGEGLGEFALLAGNGAPCHRAGSGKNLRPKYLLFS